MDELNALAVIEQHKNDLVYVKPEDLQTQKMFVAQVTVIHATADDFHDKLVNGKKLPKAHHVDRIAEAGGVDFLADHCGTRKEDTAIWVGFAQARRRMPDGTWRTSTVQEYEFDADLRAEIDSKSGRKSQAELSLDYRKFGRQRASTGARLRVIHELLGIPSGFGPKDITRAIVVSRVAVNTDYLLENPDMRAIAIEAAVNGSAEIYGPRDVTPEPEAIAAPDGDIPADVPIENGVDDFDSFDADTPPEDPLKDLRIKLDEWLLTPVIADSKQASKAIRDVREFPGASAADLQAVINRCAEYYAKKTGGTA